MLARGLEPTPEALSRASEGLVSLEDARMLFGLERTPQMFRVLANACRVLRVRMLWLACADAVPQVRATFTQDDVDALTLLDEMTPEERKRWIKLGKRLARI